MKLNRHHVNGLEHPLDVEVLCTKCHAAAHGPTWGRGRRLANKVCPICGTTFRPRRARDKLCKSSACLAEMGRRSAEKRWGPRASAIDSTACEPPETGSCRKPPRSRGTACGV